FTPREGHDRRGIPAAVWDYKIGGFQVLRKWLSYREKRVLGRDMSIEETRAFTNIARRLTAVVLQGPELDRNYLRITEATLSL
ncbi:type ISP restriction/modification enzyme, partial [Mycobacterium avium]